MYTRDQVLSHIDALLVYSVSQKPEFTSQYTSLIAPMKSATNAYFGANRSDFKKPLDDLGLYLYNELWQRYAKWDDSFDRGLRTDYPNEYKDHRKLFHDFTWLMELTPEAFFDAWVYGIPEGTGTTQLEPEPMSNPNVPLLVAKLSTAINEEFEAIDSLGQWLEVAMGQSSSVMLWEKTGALLSAPDTETIAKIIFLERGLLEAINVLDLPVYVPTYLRKDG